MTARNLTLGIDVGSSFIKLALVDYGQDPQVLAVVNERIRKRNPAHLIEHAVMALLDQNSLTYDDLLYVASTGEGELVLRKRGHFYSMSTHARGAYHYHPEARTVVDMGALFCRVISLDGSARVRSYSMTGQCASGSGQFLENITRYLGVTVDEVGPLSLQSTNPARTSGICAVLAETDVVNMVSRGIPTPDIIKGIHLSIAGRIVQLLSRFKAESPVVLTGGMAQDAGLVAALRELCQERNLSMKLYPATNGVAAGAIGAALWGGFRHFKLLGATT
ncbi:MAG TPA: BadF/BadG/BcrA/BcrD ATPase family protein [Candidatus Deferrimicrobium sp.]|nr:BadF/BadG/BcrA/BcrD ATPase family protein [Candidatus Deferrimicrobium sp.]